MSFSVDFTVIPGLKELYLGYLCADFDDFLFSSHLESILEEFQALRRAFVGHIGG